MLLIAIDVIFRLIYRVLGFFKLLIELTIVFIVEIRVQVSDFILRQVKVLFQGAL